MTYITAPIWARAWTRIAFTCLPTASRASRSTLLPVFFIASSIPSIISRAIADTMSVPTSEVCVSWSRDWISFARAAGRGPLRRLSAYSFIAPGVTLRIGCEVILTAIGWRSSSRKRAMRSASMLPLSFAATSAASAPGSNTRSTTAVAAAKSAGSAACSWASRLALDLSIASRAKFWKYVLIPELSITSAIS